MPTFTDTFNRTDSTAVGNGWTEVTPADWSIVSNAARVTGSSGFIDSIAYAPSQADMLNGKVRAKFNLASGSIPQVHTRYNSGTGASILAYWISNVLYIGYNNGNPLALSPTASAAASLSAGTDYWIEVEVDGTTHTARLFDSTYTTELFSASGTNANLNIAGATGISNQGTQLDYDEFVSEPTNPVLKFPDEFHNGTHTLASESNINIDVYDTSGNLLFTQTGATNASGVLTADVDDDSLAIGTTYTTIFQTEAYEEVQVTKTAENE